MASLQQDTPVRASFAGVKRLDCGCRLHRYPVMQPCRMYQNLLCEQCGNEAAAARQVDVVEAAQQRVAAEVAGAGDLGEAGAAHVRVLRHLTAAALLGRGDVAAALTALFVASRRLCARLQVTRPCRTSFVCEAHTAASSLRAASP